MNQEAAEAKVVQKVVSTLRMARHVIEKLHDDNEQAFQEAPSLSDLVQVAQIIGQTAMVDRLGDAGLPEGSVLPTEGRQIIAGPISLPDIIVVWTPDGWYVDAHPDFNANPQRCKTREELAAVLQGFADICGNNRLS